MAKVKNMSGGQVVIRAKGGLKANLVLQKGETHNFKDQKELEAYRDSIKNYGTLLQMDATFSKEVAQPESKPVQHANAAPVAAHVEQAVVVGVGVKEVVQPHNPPVEEKKEEPKKPEAKEDKAEEKSEDKSSKKSNKKDSK